MPRLKELPLPSQDELRKLFRYENRTGKLFWKKRPRYMFESDHRYRAWNGQYAGREALTTVCNGHLRGIYDGQHIYAHRVIWKLKTGEEPPEIDHINGDPADNRWINLRAANRGINSRNHPRRKDNSSGVTGVTRRGVRWIAQIMQNGQVRHIGVYNTKEEAIAARKGAEVMLGYHLNHGRIDRGSHQSDRRISWRKNKAVVHLGSFDTKEEAEAAFKAADAVIKLDQLGDEEVKQ